MRYFLLIFALVVVGVITIAGRRGTPSRKPPLYLFPDMDRQPKLRPQTEDSFFPDGMSSRLPVPVTVAHSAPIRVGDRWVYRFEDDPVNTGRVPGTTNFVEVNPFPITHQLLARGQERFNIYCAPCHGPQGDGKGITSRLGMAVVADLHDIKTRKVVQQPDGQIFNTITYGKNLMGAYGGLISVEDRWAIIAYVRALQRSHLATVEDVPPQDRDRLPNPPPAPNYE